MNYNESIQYLYDRLPVFHLQGGSAYKPGLENTIALMDALSHPYTGYKTIHVAGTNGKGSVSHLLAAILQSAGYKVGLYTSPHLVDFGERIKVNGNVIEKQYVIDFVENSKTLFEKIQPSFFEATMALAFKYFADSNVDIAIIEVGLGGRLDSTNIINPILSIITNISFDHVEFLGDTIEKISREKAGIIKQKIPVIIGETHPESKNVFIELAAINNSEIYFADSEISIELLDSDLSKIRVLINQKNEFLVGLSGNYQLKNIVTVLKAVELLKMLNLKISDSQLAEALEHVLKLTGFKGRFQRLSTNPDIIIDTAHNKAGVTELMNQLKNSKYKNLHLVFGMVKDKDITEILKLLPQNANYYFTQAAIARALPAIELKEMAFQYNLYGKSYNSVDEAVFFAIEEIEKEDFLVVFGSNFVVGEAITAIKNRQLIL